MRLKNNSGNEWKDYNCGRGIYVDIKPFETFEMPDEESAQQLLALLGSPDWIVMIPDAPEEKVVVEVKAPEVIEKVVDEVEEKPKKITRKFKK